MFPKRHLNGYIIFKDFPYFKPNLTPEEVLRNGSFGGTYFRPIYSSITKQYETKAWSEFPDKWFRDLPEKYYNSKIYDKNINKYKVKCGTSLELWEQKGWIHEQDPYGWFQWYCRFYCGRRTDDDERQIKRWMNCTGYKGRWKLYLINKILSSKNKQLNDFTISPTVRQSLQHWGYCLKEFDLKKLSPTKNISNEFQIKSLTNFLKIISWNINGIKSWIKHKGNEFFKIENPDLIALQEIRCDDKFTLDKVNFFDDYPYKFWNPAKKKGYSGTALISKKNPINVFWGFNGSDEVVENFNSEGRLITAEFEKYFIIVAYVPYSGIDLNNLSKRMNWDILFSNHLKILDKIKPVIVCGDLNVAHREIDLSNPKSNKNKAGFTPIERENFDFLLNKGFIDTFRYLYPKTKNIFTFWSHFAESRKRNIGWRLDYFLISKRIVKNVINSIIFDAIFGSDHCPISLIYK